MMIAMAHDTNKCDGRYVDSRASNHMRIHKNWFNKLHELEKPGYVKIGDGTLHPSNHVGKVPLSMHNG